jgi:hypothetical protein
MYNLLILTFFVSIGQALNMGESSHKGALGIPAFIDRSNKGSNNHIPIVLVIAGVAVIAAAVFIAHRRRNKAQEGNGLVTPQSPHPDIIVAKPSGMTPTLMRAHVQETTL